MIYTFDQRIMFYHVPKTAGSSIRLWLEDNRLGYTAYIRPMHMLPKSFEKYNFPVDWSFCVVRNPWERWVSWWYFWRFLVKRFDTSFEEYTEKYFTGQYKDVSKQGAQYGENIPQIHYSRYVHQVLRYENLEEDFKMVQDKFNCHVPLEKRGNVSKGKLHYSSYYTSPRLVDLVSDYYKQDIAELGYTYEV
jgi:hypothetical protein